VEPTGRRREPEAAGTQPAASTARLSIGYSKTVIFFEALRRPCAQIWAEIRRFGVGLEFDLITDRDFNRRRPK
jgi:hypothetical protein